MVHDDIQKQEFLKVQDVLAKTGRSDRRSVYRAIKQGRLTARQLVKGGDFLITVESWERFARGDQP